MAGLSKADHSVSPPLIDIPRDYNAAHDLVERNLVAGRGGKVAYIDDQGRYTYAELADRANRAANALVGLGLEMESRIMLAHLDTIDFPSVFLGAIKAGIVPVSAPSSPRRATSCGAFVMKAMLVTTIAPPKAAR